MPGSESMLMSRSHSSHINISHTFVAVYWGFVISLLFGGITILQAYIYFPGRKDSLFLRATALSILILDLLSSALIAQSLFHYLTSDFGISAGIPLTVELSAECLTSALLTFNSQMYFAYQLYTVMRLRKSTRLVVGMIATCTTISFAGTIACVGSMYKFSDGVLLHRSHLFTLTFGLSKGFGAVTDILATIAMCLFLTSAKTGIAETNSVLNQLIKFVINRGVLVTVTQIVLLITFYTMPSNLAWITLHMNVTKLYANTFFAMLNGRQNLRENLKIFSTLKVSSIFSSDSHSSEDITVRRQISKDSAKSLDMPTVTTTVVITDM